MKTFKVALIENEKEEQEKMKQMFSTFSEEHDAKFVLSTFANGHEFLFDFKFGDYDIILMDIDLGDDFDGIKISEELRKIDEEVSLVFVTNLAQYALEGYKYNAYDYIVKPVSYASFAFRLQRVITHIGTKKVEKIIIPSSGTKVVVSIKDIIYVEVSNHMLIYHTLKGDFTTRGTLRDIEKELAKYSFSLCNACYLVNLYYVERIDGYDVTVKGGKLLMSHPKKKTFLKDLSLYLGEL
jgi:DNA-binding LytR/AlgR family response regulator